MHGGHSGQFCDHAKNTLEEIVTTYIDQGFDWVGLTEHVPPTQACYLYPDEIAAGRTVAGMTRRFDAYIAEARRLKKKYASRLDIYVAFETESHPDGIEQALTLYAKYHPDYVLGSVHHIGDIPFDTGTTAYEQAVHSVGSIEALYCEYFDRQFEMIRRLEPAVVGHFDLIRIFDADYRTHLALPAIWQRIQRNLDLIRDLELILDFNVAGLRKGASEPYISKPILVEARKMGIAVVPGDDSHGVATVGNRLDEGVRILLDLGFDPPWRRPVRGHGRLLNNAERRDL